MSIENTVTTADGVFQHNRAILRRRFPGLVDVVDGLKEQSPVSIDILKARTGLPTMAVRQGEDTIHIHSTFNPAVEAERWAKQPLAEEWSFAVVFGMGLGYHLDVLLAQRPQSKVVVVEPRPEVFYGAMAFREQTRLLSHPHIELIVTEDPASAVHALFGKYLKQLLDNAPILAWPAATRYAADFWSDFQARMVDRVRATRGNLATAQRFNVQWIDNFFANVTAAVTDPGVASLSKHFAGRPAIIASAGPSLEKNVHLLKEAKGKALIIAAGSTINPLLKHGIEPDLLVSFDPGAANYKHFEHLETPWLPLVYIPTIFPQIVEKYQGPRYTAAMDVFPFVGWLFSELGENKGLLASGPSVANVSWHLAHGLGMNPIIFVGQDLAFTDGKTHADGATHAQKVTLDADENQSRFIMTEGVDGSPVATNIPMYNMKHWFEQRLAQTPSDRLTIDATEGGAKIAGTKIMSLRQALDEYCQTTFEPYETVMAIHRAEKARFEADDMAGRLGALYKTLQAQLLELGDITREALRDAGRFMDEARTKRLTEQRYREALTRLKRYDARLTRLPVYANFMVPVTGPVRTHINTLMQTRWEKETDLYQKAVERAQQYITLFETVRDMAAHVGRLVREQMQAGHVGVL